MITELTTSVLRLRKQTQPTNTIIRVVKALVGRPTFSRSVAGLVILLATTVVEAEVLHHWEFSPGEDLLTDSVQGVVLAGAPVGGERPILTPFDLTAASEGRGEHFSTGFRKDNRNVGALEVHRNFSGLVAESTPADGNFTIELFTHIDTLEGASLAANLAGQANGPSISTHGWSLKIRMDGWAGTRQRELAFANSDGSTWAAPPSGIIINENTDYYLAGSFDVETQESTYYAFDLANDVMQISHSSHPISELKPISTMRIGDGLCACTTNGLIDEVRLSDEILDLPQLLVQDAVSDNELSNFALGPREVYSFRGSCARSARGSTSVRSDVISKFALPTIEAAAERLDSATLRLFVDSFSGGDSQLSLLHNLGENDFEIMSTDFEDVGYVDTHIDVVRGDDPVGQYVEIDVTDLVLADYSQDADDATSAFMVQASDGAEFRMSMPRKVAQQPQLMLSFGTLSIFDCNRDQHLDAGDLGCVTSINERNIVLNAVNSVPGDLDGDGNVAFADFLILSDNFGSESASYMQGNIDFINGVDFADFLILSKNFGHSPSDVEAVPEPDGLVPAIVGLVVMAGLRRDAILRL